MRRREEISYAIEDLDAIELAPLESQKPTGARKVCACGISQEAAATATATAATASTAAAAAAAAAAAGVGAPGTSTSGAEKERGELRKYQSTDARWAGGSFLSPDDAIWDLRKHASEETEFRWALHTSNTDLDLARRTKCSCHSLTPEDKKSQDAVQRGDLRKHHSAETDKWSVKPDYLKTPMHDLRKHSSDDTRMARAARWLQVPEVMPNPKPKCTCPKAKPPIEPSPTAEPKLEPEPEKPTIKEPERKIYYSTSLTTPDELPSAQQPSQTLDAPAKPELKKHASEEVRGTKEREREREGRQKDRPRLERSQARVDSTMSRKWGLREKVGSPDEGKKIRSKWAVKAHFSLPAEKKESRWGSQSSTDIKSKSLKERPKYSIRRSLSPEPDPRQMTRLENRIVRRLISPEITITDAKWAPYEDASPLPTIGVKKREPKHISEIKWTPYDGSPSETAGQVAVAEPEEPKSWSPFHNVTPTHHPPPEATPCRADDDEEFRWRLLNQVSAFPIYQGGWKDESPERTPPRRVASPVDLSPPIWSPQVPASPVKRQRSQQQYQQQQQQQQYSPPQAQRKSIVKSRGFSKRKGFRALSEAGQQQEEKLMPPTVLIRAASEEPKRQRPQLTRSKALLEVPIPGITKRSLSEEVPRMRARERARGPNRARSEEAPRYEDPWFANDMAGEATELRQYVTTV